MTFGTCSSEKRLQLEPQGCFEDALGQKANQCHGAPQRPFSLLPAPSKGVGWGGRSPSSSHGAEGVRGGWLQRGLGAAEDFLHLICSQVRLARCKTHRSL